MSETDDPRDDPPASPFVYLGSDPTIEEHQLTQQLGRHDGDSVPFWMFAKVAVRLHKFAAQAAGFQWFWRRARRHARTSLGALLSTVVLIGGFVLHRVAAEAAAQEHSAMQEQAEILYRAGVTRQLDALDRDIRELRAALHQLGVNLPGGPTSDMPESADRVSSVLLDERVEGDRGTCSAVAELTQPKGLAALGIAAADEAAPVRMGASIAELFGASAAGPQCKAQGDQEGDGEVVHDPVVHHGGTAAAISAVLR